MNAKYALGITKSLYPLMGEELAAAKKLARGYFTDHLMARGMEPVGDVWAIQKELDALFYGRSMWAVFAYCEDARPIEKQEECAK